MKDERSRGNWIAQFENRLVDFAVNTLKYIDGLPKNQTTLVLGKQLARSVTSPSLNYAEACSAQSNRDFIHKMSICIKEMNESRICLIILMKRYPSRTESKSLMEEANELTKILGASIRTAKNRSKP